METVFVISAIIGLISGAIGIICMALNGARSGGIALCVSIGFCLLASCADRARGADHHSNPWLLSWIPATCCVTNDCCWEISEREVQQLANDEWLIRSTGQIRKRTDFSPDGKFYRCACDYDNVSKQWIKHQGANTRCIFVPMRSAARWLIPVHP